MNVLDKQKQITVIGALAEGASIRSVERITGNSQRHDMRLGCMSGSVPEILDQKNAWSELPINRG